MGEAYITRRTIEKNLSGGAGYIQDGLIANFFLDYLEEEETTQISSAANFFKYTSEMTVECCFVLTGVPNINNPNRYGRIFDAGAARATELMFSINPMTVTTLENGYFVAAYLCGDNTFNDFEGNAGVTGWKDLMANTVYTFTMKITDTNVDFYLNGEKTAENKSDIVQGFIGRSFSPLSIKYSHIVVNRNSYGYIYSLRFYDRALSDEEIESNFELDKANFNIK